MYHCVLSIITDRRAIDWVPGDPLPKLRKTEQIKSVSGTDEDMKSLLEVMSQCEW